MSNFYRDTNWIKFRQQIIEADGYTCTECGRNQNEVILQVHHKKYQKGKFPWEYPPKSCATLCSGCHARHHGIIKPNHGWDYLFETDLGDLTGECELCGTSLRYEFYIDHPFWEPMIVGTICCDNLTSTATASNYRKLLDRKQRFLESPKWKHFPQGEFMKKKGLEIQIRTNEDNFRIYVNDRRGKKSFPKIEDAKAFVFDLIENGELERFSR